MADGASPPFDPAAALRRLRAGHVVALGIVYADHGTDWCVLSLPYDRRLISDVATGVLASGPIVSLMEAAGSLAVAVRRGTIDEQAPLDLRLDYLRPARPGSAVIARGVCYRLSRRIAFVRGVADDGDPDDPIAHATGTYLLPGA